MPDPHVTRSEVLESGYTAGWTLVVRAIVVILVCVIAYYLFIRASLFPLAYLSIFGALAGVLVGLLGLKRMYDASHTVAESIECPYCDKSVELVGGLRKDFSCDHCDRTVHVERGKLVPVRTVACIVCEAEHRISARTTSFTCTSCNRVLTFRDPSKPDVVVAENSDVMRNYDVLLTQPGRREAEVAMALQSILVCNLPDARRQMQELPLVIVRNVPERKADAMRSKFRELGASIAVRPTQEEGVTQPRT